MAMANKVLHVVAAAIFNKQGDLLIAQRPLDKHMGGLWEFPEANHDIIEALNIQKMYSGYIVIHPTF